MAAPSLDDDLRVRLVTATRDRLRGVRPTAIPDDGPSGQRLVLVSLSRAQRPALVAEGRGEDLDAAVETAVGALATRASAEEIASARLKLDLALSAGPVERFDRSGRAEVERSLEGLWLGAWGTTLLPEELLSRRLVDSDGDLQSRRLRAYLAEEGRRSPERLPENPGRAGCPYQVVRFDSFVETPGGVASLVRGNRRSIEVTPASLRSAIRSGADFLLRQGRESGGLEYRYQPKWDTIDDGDNLLRQAGTSYALLELYGALGDERLLHLAEHTLGWLIGLTRPPRAEDLEAGFLAVVSPGEEAKLGGAALALLAIVEHHRATGDASWLPTGRQLARFLLFQQDEHGRFESKYFYGEPDPEPFESIYYPGEAILALVRLHGIDRDPAWLTRAQRGADWLIGVRDAGKTTDELPHDHWLAMALAELHAVTGDARYLAHARRIGEAILGKLRRRSAQPDWVGSFYSPPRSTPTATRAEALVAIHRLAQRVGLDTAPYREALELMAQFQLRCQLTAENSIYLPRPDHGLGGFRRSLTVWEVRIDYVQHNLSALLGLLRILEVAESPAAPAQSAAGAFAAPGGESATDNT